jgi:hypothetical protein
MPNSRKNGYNAGTNNEPRTATANHRRMAVQPASQGAGKSKARSSGSFEARFGRVILEHGISAIPAGLFHFQRLLGLDAKHLWFIAYILSCKWDADLPYPSLNKMERSTGVDIQALYRYKKALIGQGYLRVHKRFTETGGIDTDAYDFSTLFDTLEERIIAEQPQPNPIRAEGPAPASAEGLEPDSSFVARYGRVIVRYGVAAIPRAIFTYQRALGLTPQQVWFVGYILSFKWDAALPYPSLEKMSVNTGYNRSYLHEIKASLVTAGYLHLVHRINDLGGQDSNAYDFSGLLDATRAQLEADRERKEEAAVQPRTNPVHAAPEPAARRRSRLAALARAQNGTNTTSSADINQQTGAGITKQTRPATNGHTPSGIKGQIGAGINQQTGTGITEQTGYAIDEQMEAGRNGQTDPVSRHRPTPVAPGRQGQVSRARHESETIHPDQKNRSDSNRTHTAKQLENDREITEQLPYSPYIAAMISDFSDELGDSSHVFSNVSQALRIYSKSGLNEPDFAALMFQARKLVRSYQGKQGLGSISNKMAYFFATLRDLVAKQDA